ncbi:MAG: hypothetical protein IJT97_10180 [Bacteroidaceae bacterium]|nr:hypothetical protein [Bacteroidaceae bacterium]
MHVFNGQLVFAVQATKEPGTIAIKVSGKDLQTANVELKAE